MLSLLKKKLCWTSHSLSRNCYWRWWCCAPTNVWSAVACLSGQILQLRFARVAAVAMRCYRLIFKMHPPLHPMTVRAVIVFAKVRYRSLSPMTIVLLLQLNLAWISGITQLSRCLWPCLALKSHLFLSLQLPTQKRPMYALFFPAGLSNSVIQQNLARSLTCHLCLPFALCIPPQRSSNIPLPTLPLVRSNKWTK